MDSIIINNPAMIQKILSSSNSALLSKHKFYDFMFDKYEDGLASSPVNIWSPHRKVISKSFTFRPLQSYLSVINLRTREMVAKLSDSIDKNESPQRFLEFLNHSLISIILHVIVGSNSFTAGEVFKFHETCTQDYSLKQSFTLVMLQPWLFIKPISRIHPLSRTVYQCIEAIEKFIMKMVYNKREKIVMKNNVEKEKNYQSEDNEFTQQDKSIVEEMLYAGMSDKEVFIEFATLLFAGHETTCIATLMFHLASNPHQQELCRKEVDAIYGADKFELTMEDLCNLKHLERCINETLRLTPVTPFYGRQVTEPVKLDTDLELDAGTNVIFTPWVVHRNPEIYPNPEKFDPDRFLPSNCKARHPYAFIPFSLGPRNCIGWKLAMMEMKVTAAWLIRNFEMNTTDKLEDITFSFAITLEPERDINVFLKKRESLTK